MIQLSLPPEFELYVGGSHIFNIYLFMACGEYSQWMIRNSFCIKLNNQKPYPIDLSEEKKEFT